MKPMKLVTKRVLVQVLPRRGRQYVDFRTVTLALVAELARHQAGVGMRRLSLDCYVVYEEN